MKLKALAAVGLAIASIPAPASQVASGWYEGNWRCTLDGRATRMSWRVASVDHRTDDGETGTVSHGAEMRGTFWDGDRPARLTRLRATQTTLAFRHADGNHWFLRRSAPGRATGHSTWQGRRFPLACTKI